MHSLRVQAKNRFSALVVCLGLIGAAFLSGCVPDTDLVGERANESSPLRIPNVAAMDQLADGDVVVGDRKSGKIWRYSIDERQPRVVAEIEVSTEGQRGLLGMVAIGGGSEEQSEKLYVSWTNADLDLVVGSIDLDRRVDADTAPSEPITTPTIVWSGYPSASGANGGHLSALPDGRVVIGVGTLRNSSLINDPDAVNGKILALQPNGKPDQQPEALSAGWKNPFAFDVTSTGEIWVADNEPEDGTAERIGRGDGNEAFELIDIDNSLAPGAFVVLDTDLLGVCSFLNGEMLAVDISAGTPTQPGRVLTSDCTTAALLLDDGRLLVSDGEGIRVKKVDD